MRSHTWFTVLCIGILSSIGVARADEQSATAALLAKNLEKKEAIVWQLGQDGFAVKTANHLLIFDPFEADMRHFLPMPTVSTLGTGVINPNEIKDLDVIVFLSTDGDDHYGPGIFQWAKIVKKITYVFGWDPVIKQDYIYMKPREQRTIDGVDVTTIQATEAGVSFWVNVDGLTIFHGGDNGVFEPSMRTRFSREIDFLANKKQACDLAFLEFQFGAGHRPASLTSGIWFADKKLSPRAIFPMGAVNVDVPFLGRSQPTTDTYEYLIKDLVKEAPTDEVRSKIVGTGKRGEAFFYRDGKITRY